jgi:hypothetical protein
LGICGIGRRSQSSENGIIENNAGHNLVKMALLKTIRSTNAERFLPQKYERQTRVSLRRFTRSVFDCGG